MLTPEFDSLLTEAGQIAVVGFALAGEAGEMEFFGDEITAGVIQFVGSVIDPVSMSILLSEAGAFARRIERARDAAWSWLRSPDEPAVTA